MKRRTSLSILLFTFVVCVPFLHAEGHCAARAADSISRTRFILASAESGRALNISPAKIEAGLALAMHISNRFELVAKRTVDSLARSIAQSGTVPDSSGTVSLSRLVRAAAARGALFVRVDRLENIIRAEIRIVDMDDSLRSATGKGFALIRLRSEKTSERMVDPSLLTALQRAFSAAVNDSSLYAGCEGSYRVKPAPTLVPGGMVFRNTGGGTPWTIFEKSTISAYDVVVQVFDTLKNSGEVVCFDVDTRDSVFALYKLFLIENDASPSSTELDALYRLEVEYYITGLCERTEQGADVTLALARLQEGGGYSVIRSVKAGFDDDDVKKFREVVRTLAAQLVDGYFSHTR